MEKTAQCNAAEAVREIFAIPPTDHATAAVIILVKNASLVLRVGPAQQMETGPGHMAQQPHTSFTEHHTETGNTLYEEISFGSHDSNTVQENVQQETGQKGNVESQHVELSMVENTAEYAIIELGGNGLLSKQ
ncbi:hypothetical protein MAR_031374 [Mya arenaria]|uniref:Uncharacterized protein n=1 Tax=Mya arenaria TaxID=6604 RepID=A0ABY7F4S9_MYAAR|nr:hypothetical protein MAR_031374 [Mya arenaria]